MKLARGLILSAVVLAVAMLWYLHESAPIETTPGSASTPPALRESSPDSLPLAPIPQSQTALPPESSPESPGAPPRAGAPNPAAAVPPSSTGGRPPVPVPEAEGIRSDLDRVRYMVRDYRSIVGENPVGNNAEIMKAIMGGNKKGAQLGPPEGQKVNGQGELVDRWGTPYFFHQLSKSDMEIRSAGPDRVMWTDDDQVTK
jgi:hypothetical protein